MITQNDYMTARETTKEGEREERRRQKREKGAGVLEKQQEVCYCSEGQSKPHTPQFKVHPLHMSKLSYI